MPLWEEVVCRGINGTDDLEGTFHLMGSEGLAVAAMRVELD